MVKLNKKGQMMELPFQLIFSIILIAVFIYAAFYGIRYFLERSEQSQIGTFVVDFESKVNSAWHATEMSRDYTFTLPKSIKKVCFANFNYLNYNSSSCPEFKDYFEPARREGKNMFFCPPSAASNVGAPIYFTIDCEGTECLQFPAEQPYCIENKNGVTINLERNLGESHVKLS